MKKVSNNYRFNISNLNEYQFFWMNYEFLKISPNSKFKILKSENNQSILLIQKDNISLSDLVLVFKENSIDYNFY